MAARINHVSKFKTNQLALGFTRTDTLQNQLGILKWQGRPHAKDMDSSWLKIWLLVIEVWGHDRFNADKVLVVDMWIISPSGWF